MGAMSWGPNMIPNLAARVREAKAEEDAAFAAYVAALRTSTSADEIARCGTAHSKAQAVHFVRLGIYFDVREAVEAAQTKEVA